MNHHLITTTKNIFNLTRSKTNSFLKIITSNPDLDCDQCFTYIAVVCPSAFGHDMLCSNKEEVSLPSNQKGLDITTSESTAPSSSMIQLSSSLTQESVEAYPIPLKFGYDKILTPPTHAQSTSSSPSFLEKPGDLSAVLEDTHHLPTALSRTNESAVYVDADCTVLDIKGSNEQSINSPIKTKQPSPSFVDLTTESDILHEVDHSDGL